MLFCLSKLYTNIQQDQKAKLDYHISMLFAYMAGGKREWGSEVLKCFVTGGVCKGGVRFSTFPSVKKNNRPPSINK